MLRNSRSTSMGLLDGLQSLQGAPAPTPNPNSQTNGNHQYQHHSSPSNSTSSTAATNNNNPLNNPQEAITQFSQNAFSLFTDISTKVSDTITPHVENLNHGAKSSVFQIRRMMGDESVDDIEAAQSVQQPQPQPIQQMSMSEEMSTVFNLSLFQRIALFAMCFATGILLIGMSFSFLPFIVIAPHKFAAAFTVGNVLAIISTWTLVGPKAQLQSMFSPGRIVAASIYVVALLATLLAAFFGGKLRYILVLVALIVQVVSLCWYALSYIPYGRQMLSRFMGLFTG